jgi:hypothetical protein
LPGSAINPSKRRLEGIGWVRLGMSGTIQGYQNDRGEQASS